MYKKKSSNVISYLMYIFPDFKENIEFLFELSQLKIEGVGAADLRHDVENVLNFLDLKS
jgi:hypothetical protein